MERWLWWGLGVKARAGVVVVVGVGGGNPVDPVGRLPVPQGPVCVTGGSLPSGHW